VRGIGFECFNQSLNPTKSRDRFLEAHDLIVKAWTTRDVFEWHSPNYHFRYVNVWPRPFQVPHPPIWVPGTGSRETMKWVAERRYTYMSVYAPARVIKRWFDGFRGSAEEVGYEPKPEQIGLLLPIYVAETDDKALTVGRRHIEWLFHRAMKITNEFYFPPGYMSAGSWRGMLTAGLKPFSQIPFDELLSERFVIAGSPTTVAEKLNDLREELGFGNLCALLHIGDMDHEETIHNLELFAGEVMPQFADERARMLTTG
jgi:alkanesulfonate monooxygenase SsuD/methylene tetrahydromethanopterin reductase-like flavin-dependent oxidoreductase (luciferase family)